MHGPMNIKESGLVHYLQCVQLRRAR